MKEYSPGDKFVIEIEEVFTGDMSTQNRIEERYKIKGFNSLMFDEHGLDRLERLDGDYVNENFGEMQDEAFGEGKKVGIEEALMWNKGNEENSYDEGLKDAWELAKKIALNTHDGGIDAKELEAIFGTHDSYTIFKENSAKETLAKLEAYQEEIKVGDVVITEDGEAVVTHIEEKFYHLLLIKCADGIGTGRTVKADKDFPYASRKTRRHIDILSSILAEIGKE